MDRGVLTDAEPMALVALGRLLGPVRMLDPSAAVPVNFEQCRELLGDEDAGDERVRGRPLHAISFNVGRLFLDESFWVFEINSFTRLDPFAFDDLFLSIHEYDEAHVQRVVTARVFDVVDAVSLPLVAPGDDVFLRKCLELTVARRIRVLGQVARIYRHLANSSNVPAHIRHAPIESARQTLGFLCALLSRPARDDSPHTEHDRDDNTQTSDHQ